MKVLEKEKVVTKKGRALSASGSVARPSIAVRARVVSRPSHRRRSSALADVCGRVVVFATVVGLTYVGSTLAGYVALERARQGARHGEGRAAFARAEAKSARDSVEALTNPAKLRGWAEGHGFVAGGRAPTEGGGTLVARR